MSKIMSSSAVLWGVLALFAGAACDRTPEAKPNPTAAAPEPAVESTSAAPPSAAPAAAAPQVDRAPPGERASGYQFPATARVIAIGDVHGDLNALRNALRLGGALDSDDRWIGDEQLTVVQTGDQLDRGDQDREVMDVIEKLEGEAKAAGSRFVVLNGNHELMNAGFDFRYVTRKSFASFDEYKHQPGAPGGVPEDERGRAAAFAPGGLYSLKLAKHLTVARVGDSVFVHGGLLPAHVEYGIERLNNEASAFLSGKLRAAPPALSNEDSPVWNRVYGGDVEPAACDALGRVLKELGAKRLIVGHTVQKSGITSACQDRVFRIDVGLSAFYGNNPAQVLEITAQGTRVLVAGAPTAAPALKKSQNARPELHSAP